MHGPGCPVCVLPMGRVDDCVALAERPEVIFTTFGDAMRVPGSRKSLLKAKADGADVRMVYSPLDALAIARKNPDREVIFFGLGFETTMPSTAMTVIQAKASRACGISRCSATTSPSSRPSRRCWIRPTCSWTGSLAPGMSAWSSAPGPMSSSPALRQTDHHRRVRTAGRAAIAVDGAAGSSPKAAARWRTSMAASCRADGNEHALAAIQEVFELREFFEWRGLGSIDHSGVRMRDGLCGVRCRAEVRGAEHQDRRPEGMPMRRGAEGRHQAARVQGVRHRLHAGDAAGIADGLHRGCLRGLLQLRPASMRRAGG